MYQYSFSIFPESVVAPRRPKIERGDAGGRTTYPSMADGMKHRAILQTFIDCTAQAW